LALPSRPTERQGDDPDSAAPGEEPRDEILGDVGRVGLVSGSLNGKLHHSSFQWRTEVLSQEMKSRVRNTARETMVAMTP
jgi:hypothetical protein